MSFPKADTFPQSIMRARSMGPNPLKLCEELLGYGDIPAGFVVLDLGSGAGLTSALMARYAVTDWLGLVPVAACVGFETLGAAQLVKRRSPLKVNTDMLLLGVHYVLVPSA